MIHKIAPGLNQFQFNIHSQNGEDGVIREILKRLGIRDDESNWCVEFGAWDGVHLSNTFALVEKNWNAVYIEGEEDRYQDLLGTAAQYPHIVPIHAFVAKSQGEPQSLERLLERTPIPKEFELLSIDIDSYDLDVWESLKNYLPKIVVIEINSHIPPGINWRHSELVSGNSFSATIDLARKKGYTLVCHTGNCFFVRDDLVARIGLDPRYIPHPELLFLYEYLEESPWLPNRRLDVTPRLRHIPKIFRPMAGRIVELFANFRSEAR